MTAARLTGLDLARAWAWLGMLVVNFCVALGVDKDPAAPAWLQAAVEALSGRAAALFVVLAGMGLALATRKLQGGELWSWIARRSLFLAAVGGLNLMIFPPDILHYYAVYFVLGALVLGTLCKTPVGRVCERTGRLVGAVRRSGSMPDCRVLQRPRGPVISQTLRGGPLRALAGVATLAQTRVWAAVRALASIPQRSRRGPRGFCRGSLGVPRACWPWITAGLVLAWPLLALTFDYNAGWHWPTLTYQPLDSAAMLLRHTLFNGWHPVLPWGAFLVWGLWLKGLPLEQAQTARRLVAGGVVAALLGFGLQGAGLALLDARWHDLLLGLQPLPPSPLYMLTAGGSATALIGLALLAVRGGRSWQWLTNMGRMTLTLYLAHILIGMGTLEALGLLPPLRTSSLVEVVSAAALFALLAGVFAWAWSRRFRQGPVEGLMRWLTRT